MINEVASLTDDDLNGGLLKMFLTNISFSVL